ncbi:hypothetical protein SETIT_2G202900v2 [Setaria italica]|uniref:Uncharacterized protein n=1 Tax=Setaria italica TaxID=4555 RepID=A0A368Q348_SETIT|nr:hypothetical protein SETIT_2G202900v2 [Setaria italica]
MSLTNSWKSILPSLSSSYASIMRWHSAAARNPSDPSTLRSSAASMKPSPSRSKTANAARASSTRRGFLEPHGHRGAAGAHHPEHHVHVDGAGGGGLSSRRRRGDCGRGGGSLVAAGRGGGVRLLTAVRKTMTAWTESVSTACARDREMLWEEDVLGADAEAISIAAASLTRASLDLISVSLVLWILCPCATWLGLAFDDGLMIRGRGAYIARQGKMARGATARKARERGRRERNRATTTRRGLCRAWTEQPGRKRESGRGEKRGACVETGEMVRESRAASRKEPGRGRGAVVGWNGSARGRGVGRGVGNRWNGRVGARGGTGRFPGGFAAWKMGCDVTLGPET